MKREPAVAGRFYTADPEALRAEVTAYLEEARNVVARTGCIVPHAGYMFSGAIAGKVLGSIAVPDAVIILSPNHTGLGADFSVWDGDAWETPLGDLAVDAELSKALAALPGASFDTEAHRSEHSIEVILPFIQIARPEARIAAVTIRRGDLESLQAFGKGLAGLLQEAGNNILVIASSDMTHMEPADQAREKDLRCVDRMEAVDPEGLFNLVRQECMTMCGISPVTAMLTAFRELGVSSGMLVEYNNSGKASGDYNRVVGYAGMVF